MGIEGTPGAPTTQRYSPQEKSGAVRMVRRLRRSSGPVRGRSGARTLKGIAEPCEIFVVQEDPVSVATPALA